jgi:hypothetical protein
MRAKLKEIMQEMRLRMHQPIPEQGKWLGRVAQIHPQSEFRATPPPALRQSPQAAAVYRP